MKAEWRSQTNKARLKGSQGHEQMDRDRESENSIDSSKEEQNDRSRTSIEDI
jgi:hypothetical protein